MRIRRLLLAACTLGPALAAACSSEGGPSTSVLRERALGLVGPAQATFEPLGTDRVRVVAHTTLLARVELPRAATGSVLVEDRASGMAIGFELVGARDEPLVDAGGIAVYSRGGPSESTLLHRPGAAGTEDFLLFEREPADESVRYRLDVARAAGLRLVANVLEILDVAGVPRLRMGAPWLVGNDDALTWAEVAVEGCAVDRSPAPPWGRTTTPPGRSSCTVEIAWRGARIAYPAVLDPTWTTTASTMTTTRSAHTSTRLGDGRVLVAGGQRPQGASTVYLSSAELFDPTTRTFSVTDSMAGARSFHVAAMLQNGDVVVAGGADGANSIASTAEVYDDASDTWSPASGVMTSPRSRAQAAVLANGRVLLSGGLSSSFNVLSTSELYTPSTRTFSAAGDMVYQRVGHSLTTLDTGHALVAAGITTTSTGDLQQCELFEALTTSWSATDDVATARYYHAATKLADGRVLVVGGYSRGLSANTGTVEMFDPGTAMWTTRSGLSQPRQHHTATTLASGAVLVTGGAVTSDGTTISTHLSGAEVFDPVGNTWESAGSMTTSRVWHTATLLTDGRVLVAGGEGPLGAHGSAELFALDADGTVCASSTTCRSGFCVDGVCCGGDCSAGCYGCTSALTASADGVCAPVLGGTDPDGSCQDEGSPTCGLDGDCDGAGACERYPASPCTPSPCTSGSDCASGYCADGICCDSSCASTCEACTALLKGQGEDGACGQIASGTDPESECPMVGSGQCAGDGVCSGAGSCTIGTVGTVCSAGECTDALTLSSESQCDATGECTPVQTVDCAPYRCDSTALACTTSCSDEADCAPGLMCTGGQCQPLATGEPCQNDGQCQSGSCADEICCSSSCSGQCEACDVAGSEGTCEAVTGAPRGSRVCTGDATGPCAGECDGSNRSSCTYPDATTLCGSDSTCVDGVETGSRCDGSGTCASDSARTCAPYLCAADRCDDECSNADDCSSGYLCDFYSTCVDESQPYCSNEGSLMHPDGTIEGCNNIKCQDGRCLPACADHDDCVGENVCYPDNTCGRDSVDDGSCGCRAPGARGAAGWSSMALALAAMAARVRRLRLRARPGG